MTLGEFLLWEELTLRQFSDLSGVSIGTLSKIIRGKQYPSWETITKIGAATRGLVKLNDYWVDRCDS